jgi:hypothetical protein
MLTTFISLFSIFALAALLAGTFFLAKLAMQQETKAVKVPVRVQNQNPPMDKNDEIQSSSKKRKEHPVDMLANKTKQNY